MKRRKRSKTEDESEVLSQSNPGVVSDTRREARIRGERSFRCAENFGPGEEVWLCGLYFYPLKFGVQYLGRSNINLKKSSRIFLAKFLFIFPLISFE